MADTVWTIALVLAGLLMAFTVYAAVIGIVGAFTNQTFQRCPRCHRFGLTLGKQLHEGGCPPTLVQRLHHAHS